ncbi:MAG: polysaccharide deacetylase family protein [candidate division KSB1 bacterium]|nr:polysaccharide deacetylase family protein [candidate division KSB1 bacterium]MDZ7341273.1 polysaccharide deacetylase family protein [candidate division KSB1 bacterium]
MNIESNSGIPVLMYHGLYDKNEKKNKLRCSPYHVTCDQFRQQMEYLTRHNYTSLSTHDLMGLLNHNEADWDFHTKRVIITFDDGYADNFYYALPILTSCKLKAIFFVITDRINEPGYMSWQQLEHMVQAGMSIQSHTVTHRPLENLFLSEIEEELTRSKYILEKGLGVQVDFLSLPHGSYPKNLNEVARKVDYVGCFTSKVGYFEVNSDRYQIRRLAIKKKINNQIFDKIMRHDSKCMNQLIKKQKCKNIIKNIIGMQNYNRFYNLIIQSNRLWNNAVNSNQI